MSNNDSDSIPRVLTRRPACLDATRRLPTLVERLPARSVAKILGVKVETLAKWRRTGRGPAGWIYVSDTLVVYEMTEIENFLQKRRESVPPERRSVT